MGLHHLFGDEAFSLFILCLFMLRLRWLRSRMMHSVARLRFFPRSEEFRASSGEICSCRGYLALALNIVCSLFSYGFSNFSPGGSGGMALSLHLAVLRFGHRLRWLAWRSFGCESHPMWCLRSVVFSVWVHGILLFVGFAVSLRQRWFSDLAFSYVLVRPSLILHCAGYAIVVPLVGVFFCGCSCCACGFAQRVLPQVPLRLFYKLSGCVCLSCSCAGGVGWAAAFPFVFSVLLLHRLACR